MAYDPRVVQDFYDARAEKEWLRLERDPVGRLIYEVHAKAIRDCVQEGARVLELGAGAGRFSQLLARMTPRLTVSDISEKQLGFNRTKLTELGLADRVEAWVQADICDLSGFDDASFDAVICIGGALSYVFEREADAFAEMLRVLRPGQPLLLGVMSLAGVIRNALKGVVGEFVTQGMESIDWLLRTGRQDEEHYRGAAGHRVHLMRSEEIVGLCRRLGARVEKTYCGGYLATAAPEAFEQAALEERGVWERLVEAELAFCESPGLLEAGCHMVFQIRK